MHNDHILSLADAKNTSSRDPRETISTDRKIKENNFILYMLSYKFIDHRSPNKIELICSQRPTLKCLHSFLTYFTFFGGLTSSSLFSSFSGVLLFLATMPSVRPSETALVLAA